MYLKDTEWNALSPEAQSKITEVRKKGNDDEEDDKSVASNKSAKTIKSLSKTMKSLEKDNRWLKMLVIFNLLPGLSHHLKRQPSVAPGGHAV
jgi:hypothetical protein